jgi:hypothetical protein
MTTTRCCKLSTCRTNRHTFQRTTQIRQHDLVKPHPWRSQYCHSMRPLVSLGPRIPLLFAMDGQRFTLISRLRHHTRPSPTGGNHTSTTSSNVGSVGDLLHHWQRFKYLRRWAPTPRLQNLGAYVSTCVRLRPWSPSRGR